MLVYYFVPFIVSNRYLLFWVSNGHNSVTVQNWTHIYMNFFDHKDLGNHLLQLCPKVVKHPVYFLLRKIGDNTLLCRCYAYMAVHHPWHVTMYLHCTWRFAVKRICASIYGSCCMVYSKEPYFVNIMNLRPLLSAIQDLLNEVDRALKHVEILLIAKVKPDLIK